MQKSLAAASPDAYVASLAGWQRPLVEQLRAAVLAAAPLAESIKWGHLVFQSNGPVLLIRAEARRVLFGFWRGQRLLGLEPRLSPGGKYEMATLVLREGDTVATATARKLCKEAVRLNRELGDPTKLSAPPSGPSFFATPAKFRQWLARNADSASELLVGFHKVGSGLPSLTWPESVDEALCVGWIDSVRKRIDDTSYQIRFTPRRPGSIWSAINIGRVAALTEAGRMQPAGLAAFARRTEARSRVYSYEKPGRKKP